MPWADVRHTVGFCLRDTLWYIFLKLGRIVACFLEGGWVACAIWQVLLPKEVSVGEDEWLKIAGFSHTICKVFLFEEEEELLDEDVDKGSTEDNIIDRIKNEFWEEIIYLKRISILFLILID